jgi:hypothetical protein
MLSPLTLDSNPKWLRSKGRSRSQKQSGEKHDNVLHGDGFLGCYDGIPVASSRASCRFNRLIDRLVDDGATTMTVGGLRLLQYDNKGSS